MVSQVAQPHRIAYQLGQGPAETGWEGGQKKRRQKSKWQPFGKWLIYDAYKTTDDMLDRVKFKLCNQRIREMIQGDICVHEFWVCTGQVHSSNEDDKLYICIAAVRSS